MDEVTIAGRPAHESAWRRGWAMTVALMGKPLFWVLDLVVSAGVGEWASTGDWPTKSAVANQVIVTALLALAILGALMVVFSLVAPLIQRDEARNAVMESARGSESVRQLDDCIRKAGSVTCELWEMSIEGIVFELADQVTDKGLSRSQIEHFVAKQSGAKGFGYPVGSEQAHQVMNCLYTCHFIESLPGHVSEPARLTPDGRQALQLLCRRLSGSKPDTA